ncbi:MAG: cyclic nucleotide-binding domain-containing protein, partial [Deltaproteobacteria bacterium]|nr:cyclic nucleotide-binding domain-containing protein [Deltaproteobacteria bacterium]
AQTLIAQGSTDTAMFSIVEGTAHVVWQMPKGDLSLVSLSEGDVAGPLPFSDIGHEPRCAAVVGSEDLQVTPLDPDALRREYAGLSPTLKNMINNTCTCLSVITRAALNLHGHAASP